MGARPPVPSQGASKSGDQTGVAEAAPQVARSRGATPGDCGAPQRANVVSSRVFNSDREKISDPTDKTEIIGISGFLIFIF